MKTPEVIQDGFIFLIQDESVIVSPRICGEEKIDSSGSVWQSSGSAHGG